MQHHATCDSHDSHFSHCREILLQERIRLAEEAGTIKVGRAWIPLVGRLGNYGFMEFAVAKEHHQYANMYHDFI